MALPVVAIIGAGNMGSSLVKGLIQAGYLGEHLWVSDTDSEKLKRLKKEFHINTTTDNEKAAQMAEVIMFAIKPLSIVPVATSLAAVIHQRQPLIVSIAAGIRTTCIARCLSKNVAIVRAMPNTPALIGCGATALFANAHVTPEQHRLAESILRAVGVVVWLKEEKGMDTVTALSGSGPAYFFLVMEALQEAAVELGLPPDVARLLTLQTALGAARTAIETELPLATLRQHVTSAGGTTERAIAVLEENNIHGLFRKALEAAKLRSEELASILGGDS